MFGPDEVVKKIQEHLETDITIPDGHKAAMVMFANKNKQEIALATKIRNNWVVELVASHSTTGNEIAAISKITW